MVQRALLAPRRMYWTIILMGGGHFAAAVYKGEEIVIHKTFHSYTVRSKQGGSQVRNNIFLFNFIFENSQNILLVKVQLLLIKKLFFF